MELWTPRPQFGMPTSRTSTWPCGEASCSIISSCSTHQGLFPSPVSGWCKTGGCPRLHASQPLKARHRPPPIWLLPTMLRSFSRPLASLSSVSVSFVYRPVPTRVLSIRLLSAMADLKVDLTAPNGKKFTLPTGLFINNEFVKASSGAKVTSINPT